MLRRGILKVLCGLSVCLLLVSCSGSSHESAFDNGTERSDLKAQVEYQRIATELKLAEADEPYLVLDFEHKRLFIKLKGAVVWDCALSLAESDNGKIKKLLKSYKIRSSFDLQPLTSKYLYTF
ncbi:hypothetical protein KKG05_11645, partial [bacterium]|nr:hypothetical protein [bacterium]